MAQMKTIELTDDELDYLYEIVSDDYNGLSPNDNNYHIKIVRDTLRKIERA